MNISIQRTEEVLRNNMSNFQQMEMLCSLMCTVILLLTCVSSTATVVRPLADTSASIETNTIQRTITVVNTKVNEETRALKKVFLSNRTITCNDGSQAGFYLRKSYTSKKWIIFLEGGWYCYDKDTCKNRWLRFRHLMTSSEWPETRDMGGILSPIPDENPFWWNANHVLVPYCTSDSWSGSQMKRDGMFTFMGARVVQQIIHDLIPFGLDNATDLLLTGSSAGGTGAMINLDPVRELLHDELHLKHISVRGVCDSGWFLDRAPYAPNAGHQAVEAIRKGMTMWQGRVPKRCAKIYASEPWRCYFGYRLYPTLKSPLFVFQWLFDEAQMTVDNVGSPVTKQQWDYVHKMGDALRNSFENVTAVFAPSCISHSILTERNWQHVKINDLSIAHALHCWEQQPIRRKIRQNGTRRKTMLADEPVLRTTKKIRKNERRMVVPQTLDDAKELPNRRRRRRKKHKNKNRRQGKNNKRHRIHKGTTNNATQFREHPQQQRPNRSLLIQSHKYHSQHARYSVTCQHRLLERCTWPQCNHSCPKFRSPSTGEEMDFIELLKSFGLDMGSVANALGIDIQTLNNMDPRELLNLLTQQAS